jgi:hypothetical protein
MNAPTSINVFIPLTLRNRNGRPRIAPPAEIAPTRDSGVDPNVLRAIAGAWSWRRKLESGEASTILNIAQAEGVTDRFVSRMTRLAWLSPAVIEKLVLTAVLRRCRSRT